MAKDVAKAAKNAQVVKGLAIHGSGVDGASVSPSQAPVEETLKVDILQPENIKDTLHAYQMAKLYSSVPEIMADRSCCCNGLPKHPGSHPIREPLLFIFSRNPGAITRTNTITVILAPTRSEMVSA